MPAPPLNAELDRTMKKLIFLLKIPSLDISPSLQQDDCFICKEPYDINGSWLGPTMDHPVALRCGHVLGFRCLTRWVLSANFGNRCPLCRVRIISPHQTWSRLDRAVDTSLLNLKIVILAMNQITPAQKTLLLDLAVRMPFVDSRFHRVMVLWEEVLESACTELAVPVRPVRGLAEVDQDAQGRLGLSLEFEQIMFLLLLAGMTFLITVVLWDYATQRWQTFPEPLLLVSIYLGACLVTLLLYRWGLSLTVFLAMGVGVLLASIIQQVD